MKFRYTILYVENVEKSLALFKEAFGLNAGFVHEGGDYAELDTGETKLAFAALSLVAAKHPAPGAVKEPAFEIALETDDVPAALAKALAAGAELVQETRKMPWGQTTAYVRVENRFLVELCTPVQAP